MTVLLTQSSPANADYAAEVELRALGIAAQQSGYQLYSLPSDKEIPLEDALANLPVGHDHAILSGYVRHHSDDYYSRLYDELADRQIAMLNSPGQSRRAMSFSIYYRLIQNLTAKSMLIHNTAECHLVKEELGYPVFVKGDIKSRKEEGLEACIAHDISELKMQFKAISKRPVTSGGVLAVRELLPLRHSGVTAHGFPLAREYRVFLYKQQVLDYGFYWQQQDPFGRLDAAEQKQLLSLAETAAAAIDCPLLAVDCGQLKDLSWKVIEIGDPQYASITQVSRVGYLQKLRQAL